MVHNRALITVLWLWKTVFVRTITSIETGLACEPPPEIENGFVDLIEGRESIIERKAENISSPLSDDTEESNFLTSGMFGFFFSEDRVKLHTEGSVAEYSCKSGYWLHPPHPRRSCHRGSWSGETPSCAQRGCDRPEDIINGVYLELTDSSYDLYLPGARLQFFCHSGYILSGPDSFHCRESGSWQPHTQPKCLPSNIILTSKMCPLPPDIWATTQKLVRGVVSKGGTVQGTVVEYRCRSGFRNILSPCLPHQLTCEDGDWRGNFPQCESFSSCVPPPDIENGFVELPPLSPIHSQVYYVCENGYRLLGPAFLTCENTGCWSPSIPPVCQPSHKHSEGSDRSGAGTTVSIHILLMAAICGIIAVLFLLLALMYHRTLGPKRLLRLRNRNRGSTRELQPRSRNSSVSAPPPPPLPLNGQAQTRADADPDRVALIPFPDEGVPPTYEEAVRQRPTLSVEHPTGGRYTPHMHRSRGHRVVVSGVRRTRQRDNPDNISYQSIGSARQSSSTSRSMSVRSWSACDSLGSTDTVAISDSTNVTVDTLSSGTSQTPSCRGLAGSRASFDTSSLLNNEGVPLLEEAEIEDLRADADDEFSLSTRDSDSFKDNVSHTRSVTISLQE